MYSLVQYHTNMQSTWYIRIIKLVILLACLSFVLWQAWKCLAKYHDNPQGITLSMKHIKAALPLPLMTICLSKELESTEAAYDREALQKCGIYRLESYRDEGKWVGLGTLENCTNAQLLHESIVPKVKDIIHYIGYTRYNRLRTVTKIRPGGPTAQKYWKSMDEIRHGRCFTIHHRQDYIDEGIAAIRIMTLKNTQVYFHSPGELLSSKYKTGFELHLNKRLYVDLEHEIHTSIDTLDEPCNDHPQYSHDQCAHDQLFQESLKTLGCTTPFGTNKEYICTNVSKAQNATELYANYFEGYIDTCLTSCTLTNIRTTLTKEAFHGVLTGDGKKVGMMEITFRKLIKVTSSYYTYTALSLVAEIGGYVGLFLGVSVFHVTSLFDLILEQSLN